VSEPLDQDSTPQSAQPIPYEAPVFPQQVSRFKGEYSAFKLLRQLGRGGSDIVTVYRSTWSPPNNGGQVDVAQKRFIGSHSQCFMNEVSIMADLEHRNVVSLLRYATDRRSCSIMMELMDEDLHNLMCRRRLQGNVTPFSMDEAVHVILQIACGMEYVHGRNVVHRDLKSCNILVRKGTEGGQLEVKVADFGLSLKLASRGTFLNKDKSGVGTPRWMAPEVTSLSQYDPFKSDVFSFGMLCYEILVGRVPFYEMEKVDEVRTKVLAGERPTLPEWTLSRGLKDLVESCWQEDAYKRPSFTEIIKILTQWGV
jgi:serine/threonine protein kinase